MAENKPALMLVEPIHPDWTKVLETRVRVIRPTGFTQEILCRTAAENAIDAIIIRSKGAVDKRLLEASPRLRVVGRHGVGVDHIDAETAAEMGIWIVYTPGASRAAVAEHTWGMILMLAKHGFAYDQAIRTGNYAIREKLKAVQLKGKTLGIVGLGRIGSSVARAAVGFGMKVLYTDIRSKPASERDFGCVRVDLPVLLSRSDVVSVHTPLDRSTRGLIGAAEIAKMKPGAFLVNCARAPVVDAVAATDALKSGHLGGGAFDVFDPEIPPLDHPLLGAPKTVFSPHAAAQTPEANQGYGRVVEDVLRVLDGKKPKFPVINGVKAR